MESFHPHKTILYWATVYVDVQSYQSLYYVSSRERPWRHWPHPRIHAARRILYASISVFLSERAENTRVSRAMTSVFPRNTRWCHGRSRGETKYTLYLSDYMHLIMDMSRTKSNCILLENIINWKQYSEIQILYNTVQHKRNWPISYCLNIYQQRSQSNLEYIHYRFICFRPLHIYYFQCLQ